MYCDCVNNDAANCATKTGGNNLLVLVVHRENRRLCCCKFHDLLKMQLLITLSLVFFA